MADVKTQIVNPYDQNGNRILTTNDLRAESITTGDITSNNGTITLSKTGTTNFAGYKVLYALLNVNNTYITVYPDVTETASEIKVKFYNESVEDTSLLYNGAFHSAPTIHKIVLMAIA